MPALRRHLPRAAWYVALLLGLAANLRAATPTYVQANGGYGTTGSTGLAFTSNVTNGHAIYAGLFDGTGSSHAIAFSDTMGNTWNVITSSGMASSGYTVNAATDGDTLAVGCAMVTAATGADTVKFTVSGSGSTTGDLVIYEVSGATCSLDTTTSPSGGFTTSDTTFTSPVTSGSVTTTTNNDLMLMFVGDVHNRNGSSPLQMSVSSPFGSLACETYGSGFTCTPATGDSKNGVMIAVTMQALSTAGASSGSITVTNPGAAMEYGVVYAAFKPAASAYTATPSETNTASDSLNRALTASRGDSETNTASDSLGCVHGMYPTLSETNTAADTLARLVQWLRSDSETNAASDSLGTVHNGGAHAYSASPSETNTASDTLARLANWLRTDAETNTAGDSLARAAALWRGNVIALYWQASAGGAGNSSYTYSVYRGTSAGGEGSNPIASGLDAGCSGYASCLYLDYNISPGTTYYYEVAAAYSGATSPVSSEVALQAQPATVAETQTAGDALGKLAGHFAGLAESNTAADTLGRQAGFNRADSETNTTSDLAARLATWLRGDSETNTALDTLSALHGGSGIHNAVMSETLALSDALARLGVFGRSDSETNAAGDSLGRSAGFARLETEPGGASDALARTRTAFASLIETDTVGDSLARLGTLQRAISEYDVVSDAVIFARAGEIIVLPRHAGAVPGRTKTGTAPPH
jgi:hypothetical protein